jgi:hypothetical protein
MPTLTGGQRTQTPYWTLTIDILPTNFTVQISRRSIPSRNPHDIRSGAIQWIPHETLPSSWSCTPVTNLAHLRFLENGVDITQWIFRARRHAAQVNNCVLVRFSFEARPPSGLFGDISTATESPLSRPLSGTFGTVL